MELSKTGGWFFGFYSLKGLWHNFMARYSLLCVLGTILALHFQGSSYSRVNPSLLEVLHVYAKVILWCSVLHHFWNVNISKSLISKHRIEKTNISASLNLWKSMDTTLKFSEVVLEFVYNSKFRLAAIFSAAPSNMANTYLRCRNEDDAPLS